MKKINFNDKFSLTRAVLDGRKTQTRRIITIDEEELTLFQTVYYNQAFDFLEGKDLIEAYFDNNPKKIPYKVGEVVAVAQSYKDIFSAFSQYRNPQLNISIKNPIDAAGWSNKMFVKAEVMHNQIRITKVRIEKLQDISDEDCLAEGIENLPYGGGFKPYAFYDKSIKVKSEKEGISYGWYRDFNTPREAYAALIDKVGKKGDWQSNPYVFVYDFELVK